MTPFGFSRSRYDFTLDPALDDTALAAARDDLAQGRWTSARALLDETGQDWDRRSHRLAVLAGADTAGWAKDWLAVEPDNADAAALDAFATVLLAVRGKAAPAAAQAACLALAERAPQDPSPWVGLLLLGARGALDQALLDGSFERVRELDPWHRDAHHLVVARLAEYSPPHPDPDDPDHPVYDFADRAAAQCPAGSPLAVLPLVAHIERYRVLAAAGLLPADPARLPRWSSPRARRSLDDAFAWWLDDAREQHARLKLDLNHLAYAKVLDGRLVEAAALFHAIGPHASPEPWSYGGPDPRKSFRAAREQAVALAPPPSG
ncbi:hypothetical protein ACIQGZ_08460 [Streptomyces sp. NPDC092296]|uniref:hypothetical protein n=1 Tax=Streptomyces sp. NPDC092296 TaxID=3366012 RepID=UPI00381459A4